MNTAVADEVIDSNPCRIRGAANSPRAREIRPASLEELSVIVEGRPCSVLGRWPAHRGTPKSAAGTRVVSIPPHIVPAVAHHLDPMTAVTADALLFPGRDGLTHLETAAASWAHLGAPGAEVPTRGPGTRQGDCRRPFRDG